IGVEQSFDCLKNKLLLRPVYHYKTNRVEAHVFICVLALLIEKIIERFSSQSSRKIIRELKRIKIAELQTPVLTKLFLTNSQEERNRIFRQIRINSPAI
ncbi:MAG: hypothetical protein KAQ92_07155, partial [Candidatus Aenigmarchaeota archaeon]|nr:hypothetical protein [Candidatus Aenigmarchaeota archaeon]